MENDFNPNKHEQPDFAKDEVASTKTGMGLALIGAFTLSQSVQVFSRVPGTRGPLFILAHILCMIGQFYYYEINVEKSGPDVIGVGLLIAAQAIWLIYGLIASFGLRFKGVEIAADQLGVGILYQQMPNSSAESICFASDMLIAVGLMIGLYLFGSPILGSWYFAMIFVLLFAHLWLHWREHFEIKRMEIARTRARNWSHKLNRVNRR